MNKTPAEAVALIKDIRAEIDGKDTSGCEVVACVPFVDLAVVLDACKGSAIKVGAENVPLGKEPAPIPAKSPPICSRKSAWNTSSSATASAGNTSARPTRQLTFASRRRWPPA